MQEILWRTCTTQKICLVRRFNKFPPHLRLGAQAGPREQVTSEHDVVRCGLTQCESSFLSTVLGDNPLLSWRGIGFMPFNGASNPPVADYILDQITTEGHEAKAMEALEYVDLMLKLERPIPHVRDDHVYDLLHLFHRR